jgi:hypothetical protein
MAMGHMTLLENTLPMMMGAGQFDPVEMGGMFTTIKIRDGLARKRSSSASNCLEVCSVLIGTTGVSSGTAQNQAAQSICRMLHNSCSR